MENQKTQIATIPSPKKDLKVYHSLTCDANDVMITKFVDWIDNVWVPQWTPLLNIKMNWVTEITHVNDKLFFVDEQRFGPYKMWHHEHLFLQKDNYVEMTDKVSFW